MGSCEVFANPNSGAADREKVAAQLVGTLKTQLQRIDEVNIAGATKLLIYNDYVIPAWKYRLAVQRELTVRAKELRQLEDIATGFLKKWAGVPRNATRAILYGQNGLGLTQFSQAAVATQVEILEQAARGDQELRRALASQVTRHDGREDRFSPIAVAFAIWTGTSAGDQKAADEQRKPQDKKGRWQKLREMAEKARMTVKQWRVSRLCEPPKDERQKSEHQGIKSTPQT